MSKWITHFKALRHNIQWLKDEFLHSKKVTRERTGWFLKLTTAEIIERIY